MSDTRPRRRITAAHRRPRLIVLGVAILVVVLAVVIALIVREKTTPAQDEPAASPSPTPSPTQTPQTPSASPTPTPSPILATPMPEPSYTYLLTGDQITCGIALCHNMGVPSVKVTVQADVVTALVCGGQDIDWNDPQSVQDCRGMAGEINWWQWTGTREGTTAVVEPPDADAFTWATITFASTAPDAAAVSFVSPDNCERQDGTYGTVDLNVCR